MSTKTNEVVGGRLSAATAIGRLVVRTIEAIEAHFEHRRSVRRLHSLDDRMLKDIGISRADVEREVTMG